MLDLAILRGHEGAPLLVLEKVEELLGVIHHLFTHSLLNRPESGEDRFRV